MEQKSQHQRALEVLNQLRDLQINDFQYGLVMNRLNPAFGYRDGATTNGLGTRGVQSIWARAEVSRILVEVLPNGYGSDRKDNYQWSVSPIEKQRGCKYIEMTDKQREGVITFMQSLVDDRLAEIEKWKRNPDLEDIVSEIEAWAKEYVAKTDSNASIRLAKGSRQCDGRCAPYYALLCHNGASVPLFQNDQRKLLYRMQAPLCGESGCSEFDMTNYKEELAGAIDWCLS